MSLVWKTARPLNEGWYWRKLADGKTDVVQVQKSWRAGERLVVGVDRHPIGVSLAVAWAGPIPSPKEPTAAMLATVRYKLDGGHLPPATSGWGSYEWEIQPRAEMLRQARLSLCGGLGWDGKHRPADSQYVNLWTSVRRGGRWVRSGRGERFTAANIDAAIAACAPKPAQTEASA